MSLKPKTIFVIDDNEIFRTALSNHLSRNLLYKVESFPTGEDCLKNLHQRPDIIILDYILNTTDQDAGDGLEILQKIKKIDETICVIMLSSQSQYGKALQTIVKGALEYVIKDDDAFNKIDEILEYL